MTNHPPIQISIVIFHTIFYCRLIWGKCCVALSYKSVKSGPDRHYWVIAEAEEIFRLISTGTLFPIAYSGVPFDRRGDIVYYNPVV